MMDNERKIQEWAEWAYWRQWVDNLLRAFVFLPPIRTPQQAKDEELMKLRGSIQ